MTSPRPTFRHAAAASSLGADIHTAFGRTRGGGPGGWVILIEPEVHVVGQVLVPHIAGWRRERRNSGTAETGGEFAKVSRPISDPAPGKIAYALDYSASP